MGESPFTPRTFLLPLGEGAEDEGKGVRHIATLNCNDTGEVQMAQVMTETQESKYKTFYASTRDNQFLSKRESILVGLSAAMAVNCLPCQRYYLEDCRKAGISKDDIAEVLAKVMAVSAGQKRLQFQEVLDRYEIKLDDFGSAPGA